MSQELAAYNVILLNSRVIFNNFDTTATKHLKIHKRFLPKIGSTTPKITGAYTELFSIGPV